MRGRVTVMHGVNFDALERRPADKYGAATLSQLEVQIKRYAAEFDLQPQFVQTNHEGEYCEELHKAGENADGLLLNPGAWTHYSWAIRDALEVAAIPAVEVHLTKIDEREEWRQLSVIRDLCVGFVQGKGVEGYREALAMLNEAIDR